MPGVTHEVRSTLEDRVSRRTTSFRPDVEGLRALAIVPVVVFHLHEFLAPSASGGLWAVVSEIVGWLPGGYLGVDVFFVISGFLITGLLVREAENTGRVRFDRFYARRARRILPAASATLVVTLLASLLLLPPSRAASTAVDVLWAALFNADVHFANSGVDYMGVATDPSPVLHFWSLSDEEKFYVVWPVVLLAATVIARRVSRLHLRPVLFVALGALAVPSYLWSQHLVSSGDGSAYYLALSRGFELAGGGLLAIAMPLVVRVPRALRVIGAVAGFATVVWCMVTFTTLTPFPGTAALPAVLGTVLILAGHEEGIVNRGLSGRVPRWLGRISYSLYLWHWPVIVLAAALTVTGTLSVPGAVLVVVLSVGLAALSHRFIEQPPQGAVRLRATRPALALGLALVVGAVASSLGAEAVAEARVAAQFSSVASGLSPVVKADKTLLYIGDSITSRGLVPLQEALQAAGWQATVDAVGGRPIIAGARPDWTPLCDAQPGCGADLVLSSHAIPGTVVIALGSNSFNVRQVQVSAPTATSSGRRTVTDASGHYVVQGQDSAEAFASGVDRIMSRVPRSTTVYWVGVWLDDRLWRNVHWRANNAAIKAEVAKYPNAVFLDYAAYVESADVPYQPDGSHPSPAGMAMRAHWIVSHLR